MPARNLPEFPLRAPVSLSRFWRPERPQRNMFQMGTMRRRGRWRSWLAGLCTGAVSIRAAAESGGALPPPVTPITQSVFQLHEVMLLVSAAVFAFVAGAMFFAVVRYRRGRGMKPARFHGNVRVEIAAAVLPFLAVVGIAIPSVAVLLQTRDTGRADMTVKITAHQGRWRYDYAETEVGFFGTSATPRDQIENRAPKGEFYLREVDQPLVIPAERKLRFLITSVDVIRSWWVPALGVGREAVPGFLGEFWLTVQEPGVYRGQCAGGCVGDHAFTPVVVQALAPDDFDKWLVEQKGKAAAARAGGGRTP